MKYINTNSKKGNNLPKIALVIDCKNWAFHNYALQIRKHLEDYNFVILAAADYENTALLLLDAQDCDLIHFFWRADLFKILNNDVCQYFYENKFDYTHLLFEIVAKSNITTSVYDHLYLSASDLERYKILFNFLCVGYTTCSKRLYDIYSNITDYPSPDTIVEDGVDLEMFQPQNLQRMDLMTGELVIGWAGNSKWGEDSQVDHKGLVTIIKPALEDLRDEGYEVRGLFADRQEKWIPHNQMNNYYNSIDIYICASDSEGKPDPVLEAMACGLPIISTNVGVIPDIFGELQKQYILPKRGVEELKKILRRLMDNRQMLRSLSNENLEGIKKWSWHHQSSKWNSFFEKMLYRSVDQQSIARRDKLRETGLRLNFALIKEQEISNKVPILESQIEELEERIDYKDDYNKRLETKIIDRDKSHFEISQSVAEKDTHIEKLSQSVAEKDTHIEKLSQSVAEKDTHIEKLSQSVAEKDTYIEEFSRQIKFKIAAMEQSKFWKARNVWFKIKSKI